MSVPEVLGGESPADMFQVLQRFPEHAAAVRRLFRHDETFVSVCEDYALARSALARLEKADGGGKHHREIEDYRNIIADLELEIAGVLQNAR